MSFGETDNDLAGWRLDEGFLKALPLMQRKRHDRVLAGQLSLLLLWLVPLVGQAAPSRLVVDERHQALLKEYCVKCHQADKAEGKFRVDNLPLELSSIEITERWQKVLNVLNADVMPPEGERQPESQPKADLLENLAGAIVGARRTLFDQHGVKTLRRMNRREYRNTIRELLGVEINVNELPSDTGTGSFDTMATSLFMSSDQFEQYLALGREALDEAFERYSPATPLIKQRFEAEDVIDRVKSNLQNRLDQRKQYVKWTKEIDQVAARPENSLVAQEIRGKLKNQPPWDFYHSWNRLAGAVSPTEFGFADAETATHIGMAAINLLPYQAYFLAQPEVKSGAFLTIRDNGVNPVHTFSVGGDWPSGEYVVRLRIAATKAAVPARRFVEFGVHATHLSTHEVQGTMESPEIIEIVYNLTKARSGSFFIRERGTFDSNEQAHRVFGEGEKLNGIGPEFALWVDWTEVERLPQQQTSSAGGLAVLKSVLDNQTSSPTEIRAAVQQFAAIACRGSVHPSSFFDRLMTNYDRRRQQGVSQSIALKELLAVVISSPRFLYLSEPANQGTEQQLTGQEFATRLSYFLWGAPPDAQLTEKANQGQLLSPDVLRAETNRLIDDPRSVGFVVPFIHQWLGMDRLEFFRFNNVRYPAFDESTKMAARREVYETFGLIVRENAGLTNLLTSNFVVVNSLLANYYGLPDVHGDEYRKVELPSESPRGGLLGMAAIMAMGSNGDRSNPVERGAWVLRKLLNDPPPPAPANVPQISRLDDQLLTTRERLKVHQEQPQCASCHRKIDPIGFGLENFDAVGQWRLIDSFEVAGQPKKTWTIDPAAALFRGPEFQDFFGLRAIVANHSDAFARGFSTALLEYALGRPVSESDESLLNRMIEQSGNKGFATREFIHQLVDSPQFRHR